jgi:hypothetical protein
MANPRPPATTAVAISCFGFIAPHLVLSTLSMIGSRAFDPENLLSASCPVSEFSTLDIGSTTTCAVSFNCWALGGCAAMSLKDHAWEVPLCRRTAIRASSAPISKFCGQWRSPGTRQPALAAARPPVGFSGHRHCARLTLVCARLSRPALAAPTLHKSSPRSPPVHGMPSEQPPIPATPDCLVPETGGLRARRRVLRRPGPLDA